MISALRGASSAASGSSRSSRRGLASSVRPSATRCFSPPDSVAGRRSRSGASPSSAIDAPAIHEALGRRRQPLAVGEVRAHRKVRKEERILEHDTHAARLRGEIDAARRIEERAPVDDDAPRSRTGQSRDRLHDRALAGAGAAEERHDRRVARERRLEAERAAAHVDVDVKHRAKARRAGAPATRRRRARRARAAPRGSRAAAHAHPRPAPACRRRSRAAASASRRECWRRR